MHKLDDVDNIKHFDGGRGRPALTDSNGEGVCRSLNYEKNVGHRLLIMHKSDGNPVVCTVDNIQQVNGKLGRQAWTDARMLRDLLIVDY